MKTVEPPAGKMPCSQSPSPAALLPSFPRRLAESVSTDLVSDTQYLLLKLFFLGFFLLIHLNINNLLVAVNAYTDACCSLSAPFLKCSSSESCGQKVSRPENRLKHFT